MSEPKVSIIIPSYNRFEYLLNAIESVQSQNYKNKEIIVVNDNSSQIEYYNYDFKDVLKIDLDLSFKEKFGFPTDAVRNEGVKLATGKYVAFLDDDDIWLKNKLTIQVEKMESTKLKFSSTEGYFGEGIFDKNKNYKLYNSEKFYKKIRKRYKGTKFYKSFKYPSVWNLEFIKIHNCVITSSVMVDKSLFNSIGGFDGLPNGVGDYDCWLRLLSKTDLAYIDQPLFYYDGAHGSGRNY